LRSDLIFFARTTRSRRLVRDDERLSATLAGLHLVVFAGLMRASMAFNIAPFTGCFKR